MRIRLITPSPLPVQTEKQEGMSLSELACRHAAWMGKHGRDVPVWAGVGSASGAGERKGGGGKGL
jgi:hypothetical protein